MYLTKLALRRLKLIRDLELSFENPDGSPRMWTVFIGNNGTCKTTVLQAIALAATGPEQGMVLSGDVRASLRDKRADEEGVAEAWFRPSAAYHASREYPGDVVYDSPPWLYSSITLPTGTTVVRGHSELRRDASQPPPNGAGGPDPLREIRARGLNHWFCAGYGVARSIVVPQSTTEETRIPVIDRLLSLFKPSHALAGTDFVSRFADDGARAYVACLRDALCGHRILPGISNIELRGRGGVTKNEALVEAHRFDQRFTDGSTQRLPALWLSHGYQSTTAWVADLIGQILLEAKTTEVPLKEMEGLVLIDELDAHLHPSWQRGLVATLRDAFPKIQFVATTHSPMILPALRPEEIIVLRQTETGDVAASTRQSAPVSMTGSEIYDVFFDVATARPIEVRQKLDELGMLVFTTPRTEEDERRIRALSKDLLDQGISVPWEVP